MEFNEKLQELRKRRGLTQEELAELLYVSRTAISKWESGRGFPNIDSLKAISKFFSVSLDELLSGEELLAIAEEDHKKKEARIHGLVFGLLDCCMALMFFLPLFAQSTDGIIREVSLPYLNGIQLYLKAVYCCIISAMTALGVLSLVMQSFDFSRGTQIRNTASLILSAVGTAVFIISRQPYAAIFTFVFLIIKALLSIKHR